MLNRLPLALEFLVLNSFFAKLKNQELNIMASKHKCVELKDQMI